MSAVVESERKVCITGGSGFLGSWVVREALEQGFHVTTTTRSADKAEFLKRLPGAEERLKIVSGCDLLSPDTFDQAIEGCSTVIHTASPFFMCSDDEKGMDVLVKPAVQGTENVLAACNKFGVKKVVLTSSTAAVYVVYGTKAPEYVFTEEDWSDEDLLLQKKNYYSLSKVRAEKKAWEVAKSEGSSFKLAVMNPCLIAGPMLEGQSHFNTSCSAIINLFHAEKYQQSCMHLVDVRDCARAHVYAAKMDLDWSGWGNRFLLVGASDLQEVVVKCLQNSDKISDEMKAKLPTVASDELPEPCNGAPPPHVTQFDTSRSLKEPTDDSIGLGLLNYIDLEEMVVSTVQSSLLNGFDSMEHYTLNKV